MWHTLHSTQASHLPTLTSFSIWWRVSLSMTLIFFTATKRFSLNWKPLNTVLLAPAPYVRHKFYTHNKSSWPELYKNTVHDRIYGNSPAKNTVYAYVSTVLTNPEIGLWGKLKTPNLSLSLEKGQGGELIKPPNLSLSLEVLHDTARPAPAPCIAWNTHIALGCTLTYNFTTLHSVGLLAPASALRESHNLPMDSLPLYFVRHNLPMDSLPLYFEKHKLPMNSLPLYFVNDTNCPWTHCHYISEKTQLADGLIASTLRECHKLPMESLPLHCVNHANCPWTHCHYIS